MSKYFNNDSIDDSFTQYTKEEEIIEQIINNPLLLKDIDNLEEEEDEDSSSEKDKNTEDNFENKLSIIVQEENDEIDNNNNSNKNNKRKQQKIQKDIVEKLIIELFEYHYKGISPNKKDNFGNKILETKYHIQFFCTKLNDNFSKYILLILEQKIYELIEYVEELMKTKVETIKDILEIKNSLKLTGRDIGKIFEKPFQKTMVFDISSVLIIQYLHDILSDNTINMSDEDYKQLTQDVTFDERDRFENYIEECKSYFEKIESGENEEDIEVYYEDGKNENDIITDASTDNYNMDEHDHEENGKKTNDENKDKDKDFKNNNEINIKNNNGEDKNIFIIEDVIDKKNNLKKNNNNDNNSISISNSINEKNEKNKNNDNNVKNDKNNNENKIENYSNIEDLIKYINGSDNKKKRKKKKKKKPKVIKEQIIEEEKDDVFENYKINIINFTNNLEKVKKIRPIISDAFLEKLKLMN